MRLARAAECPLRGDCVEKLWGCRGIAAKRTIMRSMACFNLYPARLMGDSAYGSAEMLNWLVHDRGIEPHIPVFDKSKRTDGTFSREDFTYDHANLSSPLAWESSRAALGLPLSRE
jgi:hypothetical protein